MESYRGEYGSFQLVCAALTWTVSMNYTYVALKFSIPRDLGTAGTNKNTKTLPLCDLAYNLHSVFSAVNRVKIKILIFRVNILNSVYSKLRV